MHKFLSKIVLAIGALSAMAATSAHAQMVAKYAYGATEDHPQGVAARKFSELVTAKTNGRITVNTYGSGKLGSDPSLQSQVQGGTLEFMTGPTSNFVGLIKGFALFDLPYLVTNYKEADALLDGPQGQALLAKLDSVGLVGLGYQENGFRSVTNSKHAVNKLEDLAGLKIRVIQNPVFIDTFKALGANPLPLPYTELYGALESRAVDAQENPVGLIDSGKFYEVQKYLSLTNHVYSPFIVVGSKKWFDKLPPADQTAVRQAATEASLFMRQLERKEEVRLMASLKSKGLQVNEIAPAELARMRAAVKPVVDKYAGELGIDMAKLQESLK